MKRIAMIGAGLVAVLVLGAVGFVAMQPGELHTSRTITVNASAADATPFATDLKLFNEWSPWRDVDPNLTFQYSENTVGQGAWYSWDGNDEAGAGKQTLIEVGPGKSVSDLAFTRPFEDHATATLEWVEHGDTTTFTWHFHQKAGMMTKAANLAMDIEAMIGKDYERGLADLKPLVEAHSASRKQAEAAAEAAAAQAQAAAMDVAPVPL